jgi:uncharacterized membrane protein HdeD (DUF308 family)
LVSGVVIAALLCWCRSRWQIVYGILEIIVGLLLMMVSLQVTPGAFSSDLSNDFDRVHYAVTVTTYLSAVFVMVRGCDDIRQGWIARRKAKAATTL